MVGRNESDWSIFVVGSPKTKKAQECYPMTFSLLKATKMLEICKVSPS